MIYYKYGGDFMFNYKPLLIQLVQKDMNKTELRLKTGISSATLAKISKNEYISMEALDKICNALECKIEDVIEHQQK